MTREFDCVTSRGSELKMEGGLKMCKHFHLQAPFGCFVNIYTNRCNVTSLFTEEEQKTKTKNKKEKGLAYDVFHTFARHSSLFMMSVTKTDGHKVAALSHVFTAFKH